MVDAPLRTALAALSALLLVTPGCEGGNRHPKLGSRDETSFLRGAAFLRANVPEDPLRLGEQMVVYCDIASVLPDSHARDVVVGQLRDDLARLSTAVPDPTRLSGFHQVVYVCASAYTAGHPPARGDWGPLVERARRRGLEGAVVMPAFKLLWPWFSAAEQQELRGIGRRWLLAEDWFRERRLPARDDIRAWYRVTHVLSAVTANGKTPPVGILEPEELRWLRPALAEAIAAFLGAPSLPDSDDVLVEALVNHRVLADAGDAVFDRGLEYLLVLQRESGAFVPSSPPRQSKELYARRHLTMLGMSALAFRIADDIEGVAAREEL